MSYGYKQKRSKKPFVIIGGVILLAAVAASLYFMNSGNTGEISIQTPGREQRLPDTRSFDGQHVVFQHSGSYQVQKLSATGDDLEVAMLRADTSFEKKLAVAVSRLPGGDLRNNSGYNLRASDTVNYSSRQIKVDAGTVTLWTKKDGMEATAFVPRGNTVAVFALSTVGTVDEIEAELIGILHSLRWKG